MTPTSPGVAERDESDRAADPAACLGDAEGRERKQPADLEVGEHHLYPLPGETQEDIETGRFATFLGRFSGATMKTILVVDDDPWVRKLVRGYLERAGFAVAVAATGEEALAKFTSHPPDLVVLDLMLPGMDGLDVARRIRSSSRVPIVILTARSTEDDRVLGLELGADDYVVKPFSARELEARVRAVFRRTEGRPSERRVAEAAGIRVDLDRREAWVDGRTVELTALEFDLLAFLVQHPGRAFTRLELLEAVRGSSFASFERAVDSHIKRLRKKIEAVPETPTRIVTVYGVGYKLPTTGSHAPT